MCYWLVGCSTDGVERTYISSTDDGAVRLVVIYLLALVYRLW